METVGMTHALGKFACLGFGNQPEHLDGRIHTYSATIPAHDPTRSSPFQPIEDVIELVDASLERRLGPNRRKTRVDACLDYGNAPVPIKIVDVSLKGMKVEVAKKIQLGTAVTVEVLGRKITAIVSWCHLSHAGLYLLENVDPDLMRTLEGVQED